MFDQFTKDSWNKKDYKSLQEFLKQNIDETYREFNKKIVKTTMPVIGVRSPIIKKLTSGIAKGNIRDYLKVCEDKTLEEAILHGTVLPKLKCDFSELVELFDEFIDVFENWAICDSTVSSLKPFAKNQEQGYKYVIECINAPNPWKVRVGLILMLCFYVDENYIDDIIKNCEFVATRSFPDVNVPAGFNQPDYYVKMGNAWLLSLCFVRFPGKTKKFLEKYSINERTYKMTIQKIVDSRRVSDEDKAYVRELRKNYPKQ